MDSLEGIPLVMPEGIEQSQLDHIMVELNSLKQHSNLLQVLNRLHVQMAGMIDLASMIKGYSIWLMPLVTHELIWYSSTIHKKQCFFCSEHGLSSQSAITFAEQLIGNKVHAGGACRDNDSHYVHKWPFDPADDSEILIIFKENPREEEISLINDSLKILGESLQRGLEYEDLLEHANRDMLTGLSCA